jgi:hypothetical protein
MTEGRKLALLTALDGGCILKKSKNRIGIQGFFDIRTALPFLNHLLLMHGLGYRVDIGSGRPFVRVCNNTLRNQVTQCVGIMF